MNKVRCRPFLKWAGGKSQLLEYIHEYAPRYFNRYYEPFLGGGASFFSFQSPNSYLSDINRELIITYNSIKDMNKLVHVIHTLKDLFSWHSEELYYKYRNCDRDYLWETELKEDPAFVAARMIYLNRTCYNGLYRVNKQGYYNVPIGKYKLPISFDDDNLWACHYALQGATIEHKDYKEIDSFQSQDFVYLDPPYAPLSSTSNFTNYQCASFGWKEQLELKAFIDKLTEKGVCCLLSNSSADCIKELYKEYKVITVYAKRSINSNKNKRSEIPELLILNY
jgi:DNA adenine methylase